ncbi:MAG: hypothetical protein PT977_06115 [Acidobacteriota bacterium]|nr:hypothetical protein [Acidobacteriota bacterium]
MTRAPRVIRASRLLLVATLLLMPARARGAGVPCNDCCQVACVEAEIRYARKMQQWYAGQAEIRGLTRETYEKNEKAKADELSLERAKDVGRVPACKWNLPDPRNPQGAIAIRAWSHLGWSVKEDDKGNLKYDFSLKANTENCTLNTDQIKSYHELAPCSGMADAAETHEKVHVAWCHALKGRKPSMTEIAQNEVKAYDEELKELNALRDSLAKICLTKTCKDKDAQFAESRLEKELEELNEQIRIREMKDHSPTKGGKK